MIILKDTVFYKFLTDNALFDLHFLTPVLHMRRHINGNL